MRKPTRDELWWLLRDWYEEHWRLVILGALGIFWASYFALLLCVAAR